MKNIGRHIRHYIPLYGVFVVGVMGFLYFSYDKAFQVAVAVALCGAYLSWGVIHHKMHDDLDVFVFVEYLTVAALGLLVVLTMVYRT